LGPAGQPLVTIKSIGYGISNERQVFLMFISFLITDSYGEVATGDSLVPEDTTLAILASRLVALHGNNNIYSRQTISIWNVAEQAKDLFAKPILRLEFN